VSTRDLRLLRALVDPERLTADEVTLSAATIQGLAEIVRCDQITVAEIVPSEREWHGHSLDTAITEPDGDDFEDFFWQAFWSSPVCSYPCTGGGSNQVLRASDFHSKRELSALPIGELLRVQGMRHSVLVPLSFRDGVDRRIELFRGSGPDFSERDVLLLDLLRPHVAEIESACRRRNLTGRLTLRQVELLRCVERGLTNRQIARELHLAEGTVRRHLENIYQRLGVSSRTAAVAHLR
jgi:DNA-binding CsgD family transcriptional regulator